MAIKLLYQFTLLWNLLNGVEVRYDIETILFPQEMIQDINNLHWNIIHKSIGVT